MASFCTNCGGPVEGRFCSKCGTPHASSPPVAPVAPTGGGSAAKIIIIVVAVCVGLGALAVGSLVYVGYRAKQKLAELTRDYSVSPAPGLRVKVRPPTGNGCPLLSGEEAAQILGVAIERVESGPGEAGGTECKYWVSIAERQRLTKEQIVKGLSGLGNNTGTDDKAVKDAAGIVAGALDAVVNSTNDASADFAFSLQLQPDGGKKEREKMEHEHPGLKVLPGLNIRKAPNGRDLLGVKGDASLLLHFQAFEPNMADAVVLATRAGDRM